MSSQPAAEDSAVDKPAKAAKPAVRKRTAATQTTTPRSRTTVPKPAPIDVVEVAEPIPGPLPAVAVKPLRSTFRTIVGFGVVLAAAVAAVALLLIDRREAAPTPNPGDPVAVSTQELASLASEHGSPVYWAGDLSSRTLELTSTATGTFVRYLPEGATVGGSSRALTVATYPMRGAYTTATRRAKADGIASRRTRNHGLAVWTEARPTSVYVAFRGVPSLIEVYSPQAKEARTLALSGRLRPVR